MIAIVNYGMGNLGSIQNMFKKIGYTSIVVDSPQGIQDAEKIVLPGVGHFAKAMMKLEEKGLTDILNKKALREKVPVLGICLGMQLMTKSSEEGAVQGLGWIPAVTKRFDFSREKGLKVPHMGWNQVGVSTPSPLTADFIDEFRFYFVHSYYVQVDDERFSILKASYGKMFDAGIQNENVFGVQFHPEKSHKFGKTLLKNFAEL